MGGANVMVRYLETKQFLCRTSGRTSMSGKANATAPRSEPLPPAKRSRREKFCPHCEKQVSKSTYYDHAALYFDKDSKKWTRESCDDPDLQCRNLASFKPAIDEDSTTVASEFVPVQCEEDIVQQPCSAMDPELDQVGVSLLYVIKVAINYVINVAID